MSDETPFKPLEFQGKSWIYNGLPYREVCRNHATPTASVCIIGAGFWPLGHTPYTTLDVPITELKEL